MRVGIYPGAFDPVHKGHIAFALAAITAHQLDKVFFLPEPSPRHKQGVKALDHRVEMVRLATANDPRMGMIVLEQTRFTILETWPQLDARFTGADLYMLIGSDVAERMASWPNIDELIAMAPHFVIALQGRSKKDMKAMVTTLQQTTKLTLTYDLLDLSYAEHNSGKIRLSLKRGHIPRGLDPLVADYIIENKLYISGSD